MSLRQNEHYIIGCVAISDVMGQFIGRLSMINDGTTAAAEKADLWYYAKLAATSFFSPIFAIMVMWLNDVLNLACIFSPFCSVRLYLQKAGSPYLLNGIRRWWIKGFWAFLPFQTKHSFVVEIVSHRILYCLKKFQDKWTGIPKLYKYRCRPWRSRIFIFSRSIS